MPIIEQESIHCELAAQSAHAQFGADITHCTSSYACSFQHRTLAVHTLISLVLYRSQRALHEWHAAMVWAVLSWPDHTASHGHRGLLDQGQIQGPNQLPHRKHDTGSGDQLHGGLGATKRVWRYVASSWYHLGWPVEAGLDQLEALRRDLPSCIVRIFLRMFRSSVHHPQP